MYGYVIQCQEGNVDVYEKMVFPIDLRRNCEFSKAYIFKISEDERLRV